jgi:hypothetical protein
MESTYAKMLYHKPSGILKGAHVPMARVNPVTSLSPRADCAQFAAHLKTEGLTGDEVRQLLDQPLLLKEWIRNLKSLLDPLQWAEKEVLILPVWRALTSEGDIHVAQGETSSSIHVRLLGDSFPLQWDNISVVDLNESWQELTPNCQIRKGSDDTTIAVRIRNHWM